MNQIKALTKNRECIGKIFKKSKEKIQWDLEINGARTILVLTLSHYSGKFSFLVNGQVVRQGMRTNHRIDMDFGYKGHFFTIKSRWDEPVLKINGTSFDNLKWGNDASLVQPNQLNNPSRPYTHQVSRTQTNIRPNNHFNISISFFIFKIFHFYYLSYLLNISKNVPLL